MSDYQLIEQFALNIKFPVLEIWPEFQIREIAGLSIYWLAVTRTSQGGVDRAMSRKFGCQLPDIGKFVSTEFAGNELLFAWIGAGKWLMRGAAIEFPAELQKLAQTNLSDGWVAFELSGEQTREVLRRLCSLDLHREAFPTGASARTVCEAMNCHILCRDAAAGRFELHLQRSSARCFLDHLRHAAFMACGKKIQTID